MIACLLIDYAVKPTLFVDIDIAYSHMIKSIMWSALSIYHVVFGI